MQPDWSPNADRLIIASSPQITEDGSSYRESSTSDDDDNHHRDGVVAVMCFWRVKY